MKKWKIGNCQKEIISVLMSGCGVTSLTAAALANKGYSSPESVFRDLDPSELSDPFLITDMQRAADIINEAIESYQRICVYGDYDCDGIMSTVILYTYLLESGADVTYYIPERSDGYGLNKNAIMELSQQGTELIITVDNGISAVEEAEYIYSLGMKLIVTDHHRQGEVLPRAEAVVDPHRHDCLSTFKHLCGAGVALKLVAALCGGDCTFALEQFGDLAAIATIADVVSLTGENRFLVSYGLELIKNSDRPAIIALKNICLPDSSEIDSRSVSFGIAPMINSSGRFGSPKKAAELFLCEAPEKASAAAEELHELNNMRRQEEKRIMDEIFAMIENDPMLIRGRIIFISGKGWHHGVIGIAAARIMELFGKPCFIASEENGELRGSARSFEGFSVFEALTYASDALEKFGGHPGAGGFTINQGMADEFRRLLEEYALKNNKVMPVMTLSAATAVRPEELNVKNVGGISLLEPFGMDNEKPLFNISNALVTDIVSYSGGRHSGIMMKVGSNSFRGVYFRMPPHELSAFKGAKCDLMVTLELDHYRDDERLSIIVRDIRYSGFDQDAVFNALSAFEAFLRGEELPPAYYRRMLPSRDEAVRIYKNIPEFGISADNLFMRLKDNSLNYCKFSAAVEAMRQLGLVNVSAESKITRIKNTHKTDLFSAPVLSALSEKAMAVQKS